MRGQPCDDGIEGAVGKGPRFGEGVNGRHAEYVTHIFLLTFEENDLIS